MQLTTIVAFIKCATLANPRHTLLFILGFLYADISAQPCDPDSLITRSIKAFTTSSSIDWELQNHLVYVNPDCPSNDKLLVHLVGTFDNPSSTTYFPIHAANHGYKVISLKYPNNVSGTTSCRTSSDIDCHWKYRQEIVFGTDTSSAVSVDSNNCIVNRLEKLLIYLDNSYPDENWHDFLSESNKITWPNIAVSGHSQGGGHAAFIAKYFDLDRVAMFASPNEYSTHFSAPAAWTRLPSATPDSNYYAFGNLFDDIIDFAEQYAVWNDMRLIAFGDTLEVGSASCPYNSTRMLYTQDTSGSGLAAHHNSVLIDNYTPLDSGVPAFSQVWGYILGLCPPTTSTHDLERTDLSVRAYPNPALDEVTVQSTHTITRIEIVDAFGRLLAIHEPRLHKATIRTSSYTGLLFLRVITQTNRAVVVKILVR